MTTTVNIFTTIVLAGAAVFLAANANSADLEVSIEGLRSAEGQVRVALHQRVPSASFPDEDRARSCGDARDDLAVLADDDPIGIGPHVHRSGPGLGIGKTNMQFSNCYSTAPGSY